MAPGSLFRRRRRSQVQKSDPGNLLVAITMLKHGLTAGLAVPVELLVLERKEGVDLIYQLPSALIAGLIVMRNW